MGKAGRITIDLIAQTAQFDPVVERSTQKLRGFAQEHGHTVTSVQAIGGALRDLELKFTTNTRAAERFIATTLGLGPMFQAAFPVVGALALSGVLVELADRAGRVVQFFKDLADAPRRAQATFGEFVNSLVLTNDQLNVSNDKLDQQIAKLERRPLNGIKLGLDEARLAMDRMGESIEKSLASLIKLDKEGEVTWWKSIYTNQAQTGGIPKRLMDTQEQLYDIDEWKLMLRQGTNPNNINAQSAIDKSSIAAKTFVLNQQLGVLNETIRTEEKLRETREKFLADHNHGVIAEIAAGPGSSEYLLQLKAAANATREQLTDMKSSQDEMAKQQRLADLQAAEPGRLAKEAVTDKFQELREQMKMTALESENFGNILKQSMARGAGEAALEIDRLDKNLTKAGQPAMSLLDRVSMTEDFIDIETAKARQRLAAINQQNAQSERNRMLPQTMKDLGMVLPDPFGEAEQFDQFKLGQKGLEARAKGDALKYRLGAIGGTQEQQFQAELYARTAELQASGKSKELIDQEINDAKIQHEIERKKGGYGLSIADGYKGFSSQLVDNFKSAGYQIQQLMGGVFSTLSDQFTSFLSGAKISWSGFFQSLASSFAKFGLNTLFGLLGSWMGGGGFGRLFGALGFKADGGSVMGGSPYVVGERGPELFVPGSGGSIVPNGMAMGGGGVYYNIDARGTDPQTTERNVRRALQLTHTSAVQNGVMATQEMTRRRPR